MAPPAGVELRESPPYPRRRAPPGSRGGHPRHACVSDRDHANSTLLASSIRAQHRLSGPNLPVEKEVTLSSPPGIPFKNDTRRLSAATRPKNHDCRGCHRSLCVGGHRNRARPRALAASVAVPHLSTHRGPHGGEYHRAVPTMSRLAVYGRARPPIAPRGSNAPRFQQLWSLWTAC